MFGPRLYAVIPAPSGRKFGKRYERLSSQSSLLCAVLLGPDVRHSRQLKQTIYSVRCKYRMNPIKENAGTMLYMCRVAKHHLSWSVTAVVTDLVQLSDLDDCDSDVRRDELRRTRSTSCSTGVSQSKYDLHEFVTSRTTT
jgi:hypothetical protein